MKKHIVTGAVACVGMLMVASAPARADSQPAVSVAVLSAYTNCSQSGDPENPNLTVAFAQTDLNSPWRVTELKDFQLWANRLCIPHFIWNQANEDVSTQISNVADLLAQKPNVLLVDPEAGQPLVPAISMARQAGVPMIIIDRDLPVPPGPNTYLATIGADNHLIGLKSTQAWIEKLKSVQQTDSPKANLAIIEGGVGQSPAIDRTQGVEDAIKPYPGIKIVAVESGDWTREGGRNVMEAYLQRFAPGQLQGVFAEADEMMVGAQQAIQAASRTDLNGWFFSGDGQLQGIQAVTDGFDVADTQFPPLFGQASLEAAIAASRGVTLPSTKFALIQKTFTCLTDSACDKSKAYVAQLQATGMQF
jgi:ribose transport system substrate-binding protein